ncbi:CDP-glycerol glycerophosphotransferase family protein [Actinomyces trachealis]|uniref:bifunctional glycosyltransferase/CDP-glycerol:glycerophosphate glycerophosphotransferase n=1 Tax=Actinomyces trachealis TaxID=2763540 RepID=UPI0018929037|nr:CDP-glycerol glycerophosphotransferase family protein [Actinomyces trachealis]
MGFKTTIACGLRGVGAEKLVEAKAVRRLFGAPIYKRMLEEPASEGRAPVAPVRPDQSKQNAVLEPERCAGPKLSVIIPAYNVEAYLQDCVKSVTDQTYKNLDIVIVDDGSTDGTPLLADRIAAADPRIRVVHKRNGGLGAARNTGLEHTTGEYITFVDSDDLIVEDAYEVMMASLAKTGSDFVIGAIERFNSERFWTPAWVKEVHGEDRFAITGTDFPPILWDVFSCNKVYRRDSWESVVGAFPEGLYEDQEGTAKFYTNGVKFDVLEKTVYRWRLRDDGTSITQNKSNVGDLVERLTVARRVKTIIDQSGNQGLIDYWYGKLLCEDLYYYYREVPRAAEEFWTVLVNGVNEFYDALDQHIFLAWPFERRLLALAAARADVKAFEAVLLESLERGTETAIVEEDGEARFSLPSLSVFETPIPDALRAVDLSAVNSVVEIDNVDYDSVGSVLLRGFALIKGVAPSGESRLRSRLVFPAVMGCSDEVQFDLPVEQEDSIIVNGRMNAAFVDYSKAGFVVRIAPELVDAIAEHPEVDSGSVGELRFDVKDGMIERRNVSVNAINNSGNATAVRAAALTEAGFRLLPRFLHPGFGVEVLQPRFVARRVLLEGNQLELELDVMNSDQLVFRSAPGAASPSLCISEGRGVVCSGALTPASGPNRWRAALTMPSNLNFVDANFVELSIEAEFGITRSGIAVADIADMELGGGRFTLAASEYGFLRMYVQNQYATVEDVEMDDDWLVFSGRVHLDSQRVRQTAPSFALVGKSGDLRPESLQFSESDGAYTVAFSMVNLDVDGRPAVIACEDYIFEILTATGKTLPASVWPRRGRELERRLPLRFDKRNSRFIVAATSKNNGVQLRVGPSIESEMSGRNRQFGAAVSCFGIDRRPVGEFALFESFGGRGISDTPKRLDAYLSKLRPDIPRYWSVRDGSVAVPEGAIPLTMYSREWFEKLSTARWLINNNNFPFFFRKFPDQLYLQTWHGTPLKRIGNHVPSANLSLSYRRLMLREAEYWDGLVAQSPWAEPVLADAFGFSGKMITLGYPRNDALLQGEASLERRRRVRRFLGISESQQVILYAPTWRDDVKASNGHYEQTLYLDFNSIFRRFGVGSVVIQRGHVNTANAPARRLPRNVINANRYPDINDLYLAADVLVTDYSSVMFDFVLTGKPVVYLAPDIERYRDVTRGFYFDFEKISPGPIVSTTNEVLDLIEEPSKVRGQFDARYTAFVRRFAPLDDGHAGERVGREFFGF